MLHLIFQSPMAEAIIGRIGAGDGVVFMGSAVLQLLRAGRLNCALGDLSEHSPLYALADDLTTRGISEDELVHGVTLIDYAGLVALTVKYPLIQSWT